VYCFSFFMMTVGGYMQYSQPRPSIPAATRAAIADGSYVAPVKAPVAKPAAEKADTAKPTAQEKMAERIENLHKRQQKINQETALIEGSSYLNLVQHRAVKFVEHAPEQFGFATVLVAMFLLGFWFVRSGVMANTRAHLPLFRKLALFGLPFGIGLGLLGSALATEHVRGVDSAFQLAEGLLMFGNLPASLGYVGLVIVMLHSNTVFSRIRMLAPFGRMALTNYLGQSVIASTIFFGYGMGNFDLSRSMQMVVVLLVLLVQIVFSSWWLSRYRIGPLEWVWRALTYWQIPAMRLQPHGQGQGVPTPG
jgi:uncharacterized membrane protein YeiB